LISRSRPILCYVTDRHGLGPQAGVPALLDCIRRAAGAGVDWVQIREKDLSGKDLLDLSLGAVIGTRSPDCPINSATLPLQTRVLINDRLDVALAANAAGVHLGGQSVPAAALGTFRGILFPKDFLIGASCHSLDAARAAEQDGADYVLFGPIFETPSKAAFGPPHGIGRLAAVCQAVRIPVLAIGGITSGSAGECVAAGAAGIAAIRLFQESADLGRDVTEMRAGL
jgi:thiamine-phosphate pyrophosphorylase